MGREGGLKRELKLKKLKKLKRQYASRHTEISPAQGSCAPSDLVELAEAALLRARRLPGQVGTGEETETHGLGMVRLIEVIIGNLIYTSHTAWTTAWTGRFKWCHNGVGLKRPLIQPRCSGHAGHPNCARAAECRRPERGFRRAPRCSR